MTTNLTQAEGTLERTDDRDVVRFERHLAHPVERVWRAISEPDEIVQWLAEAKLEPVEGGTVTLRWLNVGDPAENAAHGTVTAYEPPSLLELDTDLHGILRWELEQDDDGTRLVFTASLPAPFAGRIENLAGWHIHLDHLAAALEGRPQAWPAWKAEQLPRWRAIHERYLERYPAT